MRSNAQPVLAAPAPARPRGAARTVPARACPWPRPPAAPQPPPPACSPRSACPLASHPYAGAGAMRTVAQTAFPVGARRSHEGWAAPATTVAAALRGAGLRRLRLCGLRVPTLISAAEAERSRAEMCHAQGWGPAPHLCGGSHLVPGAFAECHGSRPRRRPCRVLPRAVPATGTRWVAKGDLRAGGSGWHRGRALPSERCRAPRCSAGDGAVSGRRARAWLREHTSLCRSGGSAGTFASLLGFLSKQWLQGSCLDFISSSFQSLRDTPGLILQFINNQCSRNRLSLGDI